MLQPVLKTDRTCVAAARCGLAGLFPATADAAHSPARRGSPATAEQPPAAATPTPERIRVLAALATYGTPGSRYEMGAVAFLATPAPAEITETLCFTYLERRPDGASRTGLDVARCRNGGRQLLRFWRREDPPQ
ncbi:MAG: hypothetical protein KKE02_19875 [Alphaproteobacteria bacterium]|nr:hypothetical protein [Alphaproteobacteria bacterium]MBU1516648.1 hypothetical protein [Alphaproteobacteria bacterium]MBU2094404.1 hypothetical protein [Alphaproteobacteria bacterium]MBU2153289.1 hypothetical protein [Alphaproteobacteria bacterium]MBU2307575.1 hypothetical protein [Alphaproteobacteria bacterium]